MWYYYLRCLVRGSLAQLGEHLPYKQRVTGSSPVAPTKDGNNKVQPSADLAHLVERDLAKVEVAGSSPVIRSSGLKPHSIFKLHREQQNVTTREHTLVMIQNALLKLHIVPQWQVAERFLITREFSFFI